jgi:hypothetical protein
MSGRTWDKESVYDNEISPLVSQIIAICKRESIPVVASFQYCDGGDDGPGFCTTVILTSERGAPDWPHTAEKMRRLGNAHQPERAFALAETTVTMPDGTKQITIRRTG